MADHAANARELLMSDFGNWLDGPGGRVHLGDLDRQDVAADAEMLLDWRENLSDGRLRLFDAGDLDDFLLVWCPRKWSAQPSEWMTLIDSITVYLEFLVATGSWGASPSKAHRLIAHLDELRPEFIDAMSDESNFGLAKSLFLSPGLAGADIDLTDPASLQAAMDRFNSLPLDERKAITDPALNRSLAGRNATSALQLPPLRRPTEQAVHDSAIGSIVLRQVNGLRDYLGAQGRKLTQKGNLKVADCAALVDLLATGDRMSEEWGGAVHPKRSMDDLPRLTYIVELAKTAGAVRVLKGALLPVKRWPTDPVAALSRLVNAALDEVGILRHGWSRGWYIDQMNDVLDGGVPYYLAGAMSHGIAVPIDVVMPVALGAVEMLGMLPEYMRREDGYLELTVLRAIGRLMTSLDRLAVVRYGGDSERTAYRRPGQEPAATPPAYDDLELEEFEMTPFGVHVMIDRMRESGFGIEELPPRRDLSAVDFIASEADPTLVDVEAAWAEWQPDWSDDAKASAIVDALHGTTTAISRLYAVALLHTQPAIAEPHVRRLLTAGRAVRSHAAALLLATNDDTMNSLSGDLRIGSATPDSVPSSIRRGSCSTPRAPS